MENGYMQQARLGQPLRWYAGSRAPGLSFNQDSIKLSSVRTSGCVTVYHCIKCRIFFINEDEIDA